MIKALDAIVVGNITEDILNLKNGVKNRTLGGGATYASFCLRGLGSKVGIVSRVAKDFPYLDKFRGIDLGGLRFSKETTTFEHIYDERAKPRKIKILKDAGKIEAEDLPMKYYNAKSVIFTPVFHEIEPHTMSRFNTGGYDSLATLSELGDKNSTVKNCLPDNLVFDVDIIKIGEDEFRVFGNSFKVSKRLSSPSLRAILITLGKKGSLVYDRLNLCWKKIPAFKVKTVDETGSGDVYLSSFLYKYLRCNDVFESSCFASAAASFVIEDVGPRKFGSLEEVEERSKRIWREV